MTFSDGTPLTATTVQGQLRRRSSGPSRRPRRWRGSLPRGLPGDDRRRRAHGRRSPSTTPNAQFLQATSTVSLAILSDATADGGPGGAPAGRGRRLGAVRARELHAGPGRDDRAPRRATPGRRTSSENPGEAYLDQIDFSIVPESGVRVRRAGLRPVRRRRRRAAAGRAAGRGLGRCGADPHQPRASPFVLQPNVTRRPAGRPGRAGRACRWRSTARSWSTPCSARRSSRPPACSPARRPATSTCPTSSRSTPTGPRTRSTTPAGRSARTASARRTARSCRSTWSTRRCSPAARPVLELIAAAAQGRRRRPAAAPADRPPSSRRPWTSGDYDTYYYNVTRADGDILRTQFSSKLRNINIRGPRTTVLDPLLDAQLGAGRPGEARRRPGHRPAADPRRRLRDPAVRAGAVHRGRRATCTALAFDASSRLLFHDTWIGADQ